MNEPGDRVPVNNASGNRTVCAGTNPLRTRGNLSVSVGVIAFLRGACGWVAPNPLLVG